MTKSLIVIPVYNEQQSIGRVLTELFERQGFDVLVVDDASTDDSLNIVQSFKRVKVLPLRINLGAWGAIQAGMRYALKHGYQRVITMDGDGQHHFNEIAKLIAAADADNSASVVVGACTTRGSRLRHWAWGYFRKLTGVGIEDITSGFRLYNRDAIRILSQRRGTLLDFQDVGVLLLMQEAELKVIETNVEMSPRQAGKSHIYYSWFAVAYYMLLTTILSVAKGKPFTIINTLNSRATE